MRGGTRRRRGRHSRTAPVALGSIGLLRLVGSTAGSAPSPGLGVRIGRPPPIRPRSHAPGRGCSPPGGGATVFSILRTFQGRRSARVQTRNAEDVGRSAGLAGPRPVGGAFRLFLGPQTTIAPPAGWRWPTDAEADQRWRNQSATRFLRAHADFDRDGRIDQALLLVERTNRNLALFVFRAQSGGGFDIERPNLFDEPPYLAIMGIEAVPSSPQRVLCAEDPLVLTLPAIASFK